MKHGQFIVMVLVAVVAGGALGAVTAPAPDTKQQTKISRELVVFETHDCVYCRLFHRDVVPAYRRSGRADELPIRFVDVSDAAPLAPALASPLTIVPTVVMIVDGREAGRITGYTGRAAFEQMVSHLLAAP